MHKFIPALADRAHDRERGSSSVGMAMTVTVILLMFWMLIQASLWWFGRQVAIGAAQQGAREAASMNGTAADGGQVASAFITKTGSSVLTSSSVSPSRTAERATVTVRATSISLVPFLDIEITQTASMPVERYTNPGANR